MAVNRSTHKSNIDALIDRTAPYDGNPLIQKLEDQEIRDEGADSFIFRIPDVSSINEPSSAISVDFTNTDRYDIDSGTSSDPSFLITVSNIFENDTGVISITKRSEQTFTFSNATVTPTELIASQIGKTEISFFVRNLGGTFYALAGYKITIGTGDLADESVTTDKIASGAVTNGKIGSGAVTSTKIGSSAVTTAKIDSEAVTTDKIDNLSVTNSKLASNSVSEAKIIDGSVTTDKIADRDVTEDKLASNSVTNTKMADDSVDTDEIVNEAVTTAKIDDEAVTTDKIDNEAVTTAKIDDEAVTSDKIADGAVGAVQVSDSIVRKTGTSGALTIYTLGFTNWDMDTSSTRTIGFSSIDFNRITSKPRVVIVPDSATDRVRNLEESGSVTVTITSSTSIQVLMSRTTGGLFDNTLFNNSSVVRGYITFEYLD